jgi:hypothetical protein
MISSKETKNIAERLSEASGCVKSDDIVEFSLFIETLAVKKKTTLLDTILEFCEEYYIEPTEVISQISKSLKDKMEMELIEEGKLPKFTTKNII